MSNRLEKRREERENAFLMIFEWEFDTSRSLEEVYGLAKESREVEDSAYIWDVLRGIEEHREELNALIEANANGWKRSRLSPVAASVMLLACYEMLYRDDIPVRVSLNEAMELMKKFDEDKARVFVNGVLNTVAQKIEKKDDSAEEA
ncbi:MAG: transcription antitermination factor NusB [Clostridia bacterium]|nr:transcription antitermination factor NusB [Clostridia bacterium]